MSHFANFQPARFEFVSSAERWWNATKMEWVDVKWRTECISEVRMWIRLNEQLFVQLRTVYPWSHPNNLRKRLNNKQHNSNSISTSSTVRWSHTDVSQLQVDERILNALDLYFVGGRDLSIVEDELKLFSDETIVEVITFSCLGFSDC